MTSDLSKQIHDRIKNLSSPQLRQVIRLLDTLESMSKPTGVAWRDRDESRVRDPWARFSAPTPVTGAPNLPPWKRALLCPPLDDGKLFAPTPSLARALTLKKDWPIDRIVVHPRLKASIAYSSRYLRRLRAVPLDPPIDLIDCLQAIDCVHQVPSGPHPLKVIPHARTAQNAASYRYMRVIPGHGIDTKNYPIPATADQKSLVVNVTHLRHWLLILGGHDYLIGVSIQPNAAYLSLRTPYFVITQELIQWPDTIDGAASGA